MGYKSAFATGSGVPLLSNVRWRGFEMWLGSTVELLAGALPYNEEIVDFSLFGTGRRVSSLSSVSQMSMRWCSVWLVMICFL